MRVPLNCIVYKNETPLSNRTWIKCFFNPILRLFGWQLASLVENGKVIKNHILQKLDKCYFNIWKQYKISLIEDWGDVECRPNRSDSCTQCFRRRSLICIHCPQLEKS